MSTRTYNVLFLCARNSARSIMAEALLNAAPGGRFRAYSAGSQPAGALHPYAMEQTRLLGTGTDELRSKSWDEFSADEASAMDFVITISDEQAGEECPRWPGQPSTANWSFRSAGSSQEFSIICREIRARLEIFRNLPGETLDELALQRKIARIARM